MILKINSPKWNESLGDTEIDKATQDYGGFASDFKELAAFIEAADTLFKDCLKKNKVSDDSIGFIGTDYPHPIAFDRSYDLAQTQETHKTTLRILYSACYLKPEFERILGINAAKAFYVKLENCLRFINTDGSDNLECMSGICKVKIPPVVTYKTKSNKSNWIFAGDIIQDGSQRLINEIIANLIDWQERKVLAGTNTKQGFQGGEWSTPMTKSDMMTRLHINGYKKFNTFAKKYGIEQSGNRQLWTIRLDGMDKSTRQKLEKA